MILYSFMEHLEYMLKRRREPEISYADETSLPMISLVVPAFNEGPVIEAALRSLLQLDYPNSEILVVDDGSSDQTAARAEAAGARVVRHPYNKGNGAAVKTGLREARFPVVLLMDADGQHDPDEAQKIVAPIGTYDMVIGARAAAVDIGAEAAHEGIVAPSAKEGVGTAAALDAVIPGPAEQQVGRRFDDLQLREILRLRTRPVQHAADGRGHEYFGGLGSGHGHDRAPAASVHADRYRPRCRGRFRRMTRAP